MSEPVHVVTITVDQLREIVDDAVTQALDRQRHAGCDEWLDTDEAARLLRVHTRTVAKLAKSGALPATRVGRLWRFRRSDVEAYMSGGGTRADSV